MLRISGTTGNAGRRGRCFMEINRKLEPAKVEVTSTLENGCTTPTKECILKTRGQNGAE